MTKAHTKVAATFTIHDVKLTLETNNPQLLQYATEHLHCSGDDSREGTQIHINCHWSRAEWDPEDNPFAGNGSLNVLGKRMLGDDRQLIWLNTLKMKGLQLKFSKQKDTYYFDVVYRFHPKKGKLDRLPEYEFKKYFSLMSYLVYYPLMWYLENQRGFVPLHASALAHQNGAILIGGLGGVGKTTTCVALMQKANLQLISENIVFTDGDWIYPCYEPIRLNENSLAMLNESSAQLTPMKFPQGLKDKWLFHYQLNGTAQANRPAVLFLPVFSETRFVAPVAPEVAAEKMFAMNRLTRELDDYQWYASALDMLWPRPGAARHRFDALLNCFSQIPCYELGIDRTAGVDAVVSDILNKV